MYTNGHFEENRNAESVGEVETTTETNDLLQTSISTTIRNGEQIKHEPQDDFNEDDDNLPLIKLKIK